MLACVCLHVKALLEALVHIFVWFNHNVTDVVNVVIYRLVILSDAKMIRSLEKNLSN